MSVITLEKLIRPAAVTEFNGTPRTLLTFATLLTGRRRVAWLTAGRLSADEHRFLTERRQSGYVHAAPTVTAVRWTVATNVTCRDADVLALYLPFSSPADAVRLADDLAAFARETRRSVLFLRPTDALPQPSSADERLLITAESVGCFTRYAVSPVFASRASEEKLPVAEVLRPVNLTPLLEHGKAVCQSVRDFLRFPTWQPAY